MKIKQLFIFTFLLLPLLAHAQRVKQVCGEYTYYAEGNESPNQAKLKAWEGAQAGGVGS